jgi:hypothetical protein
MTIEKLKVADVDPPATEAVTVKVPIDAPETRFEELTKPEPSVTSTSLFVAPLVVENVPVPLPLETMAKVTDAFGTGLPAES